MLFSKFYIALLIINGAFAWFVLTTDIIAGVAFTAPFSFWSYGAYMATVMPMAMMTAMFLLSSYYSKNEKQVEVLTSATPVDEVKYMLVRNATVALGFLLLILTAILLSSYFYSTYFGYWNFGFLWIAVLTIMPGFVFFIGLGHWAGSVRTWFLYVLVPVTFAVGFLRHPIALDIYGGGYYSGFPLTLPVGADGEPAFVLSAVFLVTRALYLIIGGACWLYALYKSCANKKAGSES